jgi:hypothetical protein
MVLIAEIGLFERWLRDGFGKSTDIRLVESSARGSCSECGIGDLEVERALGESGVVQNGRGQRCAKHLRGRYGNGPRPGFDRRAKTAGVRVEET